MSKYQTMLLGGLTMFIYFVGAGFLLGIGSSTGLENIVSEYTVLEPIKATLFLASSLAESWSKMSIVAAFKEAPFELLIYSCSIFLVYLAYTNKRFGYLVRSKLVKFSNIPLRERLDSKFGIVFGVVVSLATPLIFTLGTYFLITFVLLLPIFPFFSGGYSAAKYYVEKQRDDKAHHCTEEKSVGGCNTFFIGNFSFKGRIIYKSTDSAVYRHNKRFYFLTKNGENCVVGAYLKKNAEDLEKSLCEKLVSHRMSIAKASTLTH